METASDLIELRDSPLDVGAAVASVSDGGAGAIAVFLGTTRREKNAEGHPLIALDYEAYGEMAGKQMRTLAQEARQRWPIQRMAVLHRIGRAEVGQPSVLIAVSSPHRAEAFEACRFLIDRLKAEATIWKKEIWDDGSSSWVGEHNENQKRN
jgi:molybdopterin synthase catalytic subunit